MDFWTAAQTLAALAPQPAAPVADYVILGDEARRGRLERLIERRPAGGRRLRELQEGGLYYASCISVWRHDPEQSEACLVARLPRRAGGTVLLNTYHPAGSASDLTVTCHGLGGTGRARLGARPGRRDPAALERCLDRALTAFAPPPRQRVGVRWADRFEIEDPAQARLEAKRVLLVAVDHVGIPRGATGNCLVQGRVVRQERGSGIGPGAIVEAGIPCAATPGLDGKRRRIWMGAMRQGRFARLYLAEGQGLADFEPVGR